MGAGGRVAGHGGLADIQRLGADLADVVDPHQARGVAALGIVELDFRLSGAWVRPLRTRPAGNGLEGVLGIRQQAVERGEASRGHAWIVRPGGEEVILDAGARSRDSGRGRGPHHPRVAVSRGARYNSASCVPRT
ncbi:hypothetical protein GCM10007164_19810 [Luteimonas padinae]|nr:hypothetical protein GCM10007164_19810 [Luteimonas padinae]